MAGGFMSGLPTPEAQYSDDWKLNVEAVSDEAEHMAFQVPHWCMSGIALQRMAYVPKVSQLAA
jgi:hypothetical protein